jgi:murein DD-endopeptidase MepM/ murein hydrolase activator NlpD
MALLYCALRLCPPRRFEGSGTARHLAKILLVKFEILARLTPIQMRQLRFSAIALCVSSGAFATLGVVGPETIPTAVLTQPLVLANTQLFSIDGEDQGVFREERVQRGDTLATLLARLGISDSAAFQYLRSNAEARVLTNNLRPGRAIRAETDGDGELVNLSYSLSPSETVTIERDGDQFTTSKAELQLERRVQMKSAEIRHSLFGAADATGLPDSVTTQIAEVFSGDIDFYKDIRKGDRFQVVYEMFYHQGEFVKAGRVLTAEFINNGKTFAAVWYDNPADKEASGYYTPDGKNPLEFSRVTSGFGGRMHPIHNTWRQHTGVDYGAPSGTRIRATSDGVIEFAGRQGGYGNVVIVRHQGRFTTLYAHMSGFAPGVKTGARVSQGEVVGYVGQTGWATGPHLHYEFRVASAAVNPLTITLPAALPLEAKYLADFKQKAMPLNLRIAKMREAPLLAAANFE